MRSDAPGAATHAPSAAPPWPRWAVALGAVIVAVALLALVSVYLEQRTLFSDEVSLVQSFIHRDGFELLKPLEKSQISPAGFLLIQDAIVDSVGRDALGMRLLPMLGAGLAMPLMFFAVRQTLGPFGGLVALTLLAFCSAVIYWGTQNKPYTFDLLMSLALLVSACGVWRRPGRVGPLLVWGAVATVAIVFSLPAVFWIAGTGLALLIEAAARRDRRAVLSVIAAGLPAAAAVLAYYVWVLAPIRADQRLMGFMNRFWADKFMPWPWADPAGLAELSVKLFVDPLSLEHMAGLGLTLFVLGAAYLVAQRRGVALMLLLTLGLAMAASMLERYPLAERLALFTLPLLALPIGAALDGLWDTRARWARGAAGIFAAALVAYPLLGAGRVDTQADFAPLMDRLSRRVEPGDTVYFYHGMQFTLDHYRDRLGRWPLDGAQVHRGADGSNDPLVYAEEFEALVGRPRVWLVFARTDPFGIGDEGRTIRNIARRYGHRTDVIRYADTSAQLFDFTSPVPPQP